MCAHESSAGDAVRADPPVVRTKFSKWVPLGSEAIESERLLGTV